jgi:hypothetical protein
MAMGRKGLRGGVAVTVVMLVGAMGACHVEAGGGSQKGAVLHATVTITGGVAFTGSYDARMPVATCADVAKGGTGKDGMGRATFMVPIPMGQGGDAGAVGGGHTFSTDVAAFPYKGPGTYTGSTLTATQMDADTRPGDQETHVFAFPTGVGTMVVKPDASGSFTFSGLQDAGSVKISGQVVWTCS